MDNNSIDSIIRKSTRITYDNSENLTTDWIDMVMCRVEIDKEVDLNCRKMIKRHLDYYPRPEKLNTGENYFDLAKGLRIESDEALRLIALGKHLRMWRAISLLEFGYERESAVQGAEEGMLYLVGYQYKQDE